MMSRWKCLIAMHSQEHRHFHSTTGLQLMLPFVWGLTVVSGFQLAIWHVMFDPNCYVYPVSSSPGIHGCFPSGAGLNCLASKYCSSICIHLSKIPESWMILCVKIEFNSSWWNPKCINISTVLILQTSATVPVCYSELVFMSSRWKNQANTVDNKPSCR